MHVTTNNGPEQHFFSLKWRALLIFSLLLLGINSFSTLYFSRDLLDKFELERKSSYAQQVKELEGMLRQSSGNLLSQAETISSMSVAEDASLAGNIRNTAKDFESHWPAIQMGGTVDIAQIYSTRGELVQSLGSEGAESPNLEIIRNHVQEVNKTERPLAFVECANTCMQLIGIPVLAKGKHSGVIVLGISLAVGVVGFKDVTGVDLGILNILTNGQMANSADARSIVNWGGHVSALTDLEQNLPLLQSVAAKQRSLTPLVAGLSETFRGREFEMHVVPFDRFAVRGNAFFILIDDITQSKAQIRNGIRRNIIFGVAGLVLSELILLLILWGPLSRLRRTADLLPLLAQNAFEKIRTAVSSARRNGRYRDEFDMLDDTLVDVSRQLENLQAEVDRRAVSLRETNQLLEKELVERKQAEEQIRLLNEELEARVQERTQQLLAAQEELVRKEKLAVLGQVAGSVGHELRNPLGVMSNAVYFLQTVLADADDSVKEYLDIIKNEIAGSDRIVSDLLDSVRIKPPQPEAVGVAELIQQTLGKCTVPPSVSLKLEIPATLPPLRVDALQIHQVLRNLISNGIESMAEGGMLEIRAIENTPDATVTISVRDSGSGIAPEVLGKLFQPLFTTKARGIGLGLVVVKNLTQANGGRVEVQSEIGKGSVFSVILPANLEKGA